VTNGTRKKEASKRGRRADGGRQSWRVGDQYRMMRRIRHVTGGGILLVYFESENEKREA